MNKWAISNKVLRKMLEIAKSKGFSSTEQYLKNQGKNFDIIDFDPAPIKTFKQTISPEGKYPKRFYNKDGTGNLEALHKFIGEGKMYRGVPGTKDSPMAGLLDEINFSKARQAEIGKPVDRFHTMHPEKAYVTDKSSVMYQSDIKDLAKTTLERRGRLHGHVGQPGVLDDTNFEATKKVFMEGKSPRESGKFQEVPGRTSKVEDQFPTYEFMSSNESLPEKVRVYIPHNKAKREFTDLGVMNHAQIKLKAKQLQDKAKLFY